VIIKKEHIEKYITFRNYFNKGRGETNWLKDSAKDAVYVLAAIYILGNESWLYYLLFGLYGAYLVFCFWLGYWWDKKKAYNIENDWGFKRSGLKGLLGDEKK